MRLKPAFLLANLKLPLLQWNDALRAASIAERVDGVMLLRHHTSISVQGG